MRKFTIPHFTVDPSGKLYFCIIIELLFLKKKWNLNQKHSGYKASKNYVCIKRSWSEIKMGAAKACELLLLMK